MPDVPHPYYFPRDNLKQVLPEMHVNVSRTLHPVSLLGIPTPVSMFYLPM